MFEILWSGLVYYCIFNSTYYISSGILFLFDYYGTFAYHKAQDSSNNEIMEVYRYVLPVVVKNTFLFSVPFALLGGLYDVKYQGDFSMMKCLFDMFVALLCIDPFFYCVHRMLHIPMLYKLIHKKHHEITKPVGMAAVYSTVANFYLNDVIPVYLPLYITGAHPITVKIWTVISVSNAVIFAHSGFKWIASFHDKHHQCFTKNYGTDFFVDKLMGTYA